MNKIYNYLIAKVLIKKLRIKNNIFFFIYLFIYLSI